MNPDDRPRDYNHPDFPLAKHDGTATRAAYWYKYVNGERVLVFGNVADDPTGAVAWKLWDIERARIESGIDTRAGANRRAIARAVVQSMPTPALATILVIDPKTCRVACSRCYATHRIGFNKSWEIPDRSLRCRWGCTEESPATVRAAILAAILPPEISIDKYRKLVEARHEVIERIRDRCSWDELDKELDRIAEREGAALHHFITTYATKVGKYRSRRVVKATRANLLTANVMTLGKVLAWSKKGTAYA